MTTDSRDYAVLDSNGFEWARYSVEALAVRVAARNNSDRGLEALAPFTTAVVEPRAPFNVHTAAGGKGGAS